MIEKGKTIRRPGCQPAGWKNNKNSKNKQIVWLLRKKQSENWFWQSERGKNSQETGLPASRLEKIVKKTIKTNGLCDCCAQQCVLGGRTLGWDARLGHRAQLQLDCIPLFVHMKVSRRHDEPEPIGKHLVNSELSPRILQWARIRSRHSMEAIMQAQDPGQS